MLNRSRLLVLLAVTVVVITAAVLSRQSSQGTATAPQGPYFPGLLDRSNDIAEAAITSHSGAITLSRVDGAWQLAEKDGYPADAAKVRELILGMARLERVEAKTSKPELYGKIDLDDPSQPDSGAKQIRLLDAAGKELAVLVLGKKRPEPGSAGRSQFYVRSPGDPQAWLVEGWLPSFADNKDWMAQELVGSGLGEIRSVTVSTAGDTWTVSREDQKANKYLLEGLKAGEETKSQYRLNQVARTFKGLKLEDARPSTDPMQGKADGSEVKAETFDGVAVTLTVHKNQNEYLGSLEAAYTPEKAPKKTIADEVKRRNALWRRWVYVLPDYQVKDMLIARADLIKGEADTKADGGQ